MDILTAHELFGRREDRSALEVDILVDAPGGAADAWPAGATAAVVLPGWLDDAATDDDLDEALDQFITLLDSGVVTEDQWTETTSNVIDAVLEWGAQQEAEVDLG